MAGLDPGSPHDVRDYLCLNDRGDLEVCDEQRRAGDLKFFLRPSAYATIHIQGDCPSAFLIEEVQAEDASACAASCQQELTCGNFAFGAEHVCRLFTECPAYDASSAELFTAFEMLGPGSEGEVRHEGETLADKYAREFAEHEEFLCSENRDTSGTCRFFGCYQWRGETECVDRRCVCAPGQCANNEGVCVSPADFHNHWCGLQTDWVRFCPH